MAHYLSGGKTNGVLAWPQLPELIDLDLISFRRVTLREGEGRKILARRTKGPGNGMHRTCSTFVLPVIHGSGNWTWLFALFF
jgi:hypothetical protein